jgi:hypothetical protein
VRYVRPDNYRLNPRREISLLDKVVEARSASRFTFTEEEALADVWASGEDARLREDSRFWEIEGVGHFQLAQHTLANETLADRLWQGVWDGSDVEAELRRLDEAAAGSFHVFCPADPRFVRREGRLILAACPTVAFAGEARAALDALVGDLLRHHRQIGTPLGTRQFIELALRVKDDLPIESDDVERAESWLCNRSEWAEIAHSLWLPADMVPSFDAPKPLSVWRIRGGHDGEVAAEECKVVESAGGEEHTAGGCVLQLPDPPVERHPDSAVSWTHVLRAVHILSSYLPVPTGARFRYPRFVGRKGAVAVSALSHDTGREGYLWLDREHHRFSGDLLVEIIEWEEAGRKLLISWRPEGIVVRLGEVDSGVQREERRHVDPKALHELRLGRGESYRHALVSLLRRYDSGVSFRALYDELVKVQGHHPSRSSIRAVLTQSPEFFHQDSGWHWRAVPGAAEVFRRRVVLGELSAGAPGRGDDLGALADAVNLAIRELLS